jgi:hypothetical protein
MIHFTCREFSLRYFFVWLGQGRTEGTNLQQYFEGTGPIFGLFFLSIRCSLNQQAPELGVTIPI